MNVLVHVEDGSNSSPFNVFTVGGLKKYLESKPSSYQTTLRFVLVDGCENTWVPYTVRKYIHSEGNTQYLCGTVVHTSIDSLVTFLEKEIVVWLRSLYQQKSGEIAWSYVTDVYPDLYPNEKDSSDEENDYEYVTTPKPVISGCRTRNCYCYYE